MAKMSEAPIPEKPRRGRPPTLGPKMTKRYMIRCTEAEFEQWQRHVAAQKRRMTGPDADRFSVSTWIRNTANTASGRSS